MSETRFVGCELALGCAEEGYCPTCRGEGVVEVDVAPIDIDDLPPAADPIEYCRCIGGDSLCHPNCSFPTGDSVKSRL